MVNIDNKKLPDFLCVGVEKCGSTTLYDLLKQHPLIGLSLYKETHFFNSNWEKGLEWYADKFTHCEENCRAIGEITPAYHRFEEVIPRIKQTLSPDTKIIILLREPRRRAFSHYIHDFSHQQEITDLVYKRYLTTTAYAPILKNYFNAFGKENCLVLIFEEDVLPDQQQLIDKVCTFLNISSAPIKLVHSNVSCLPIACQSPNQNSLIAFEKNSLAVPANSLLVYTGHAQTTRVIPHTQPEEQHRLIEKINRAVAFIPALKSSIIFEQNVEKDLGQVEKLLARNLASWRKPLGDLQARFASQPEFTPA